LWANLKDKACLDCRCHNEFEDAEIEPENVDWLELVQHTVYVQDAKTWGSLERNFENCGL
jgi:hypothetical protein